MLWFKNVISRNLSQRNTYTMHKDLWVTTFIAGLFVMPEKLEAATVVIIGRVIK